MVHVWSLNASDYDHYLLGIPLIPSMQRWRQVQEDPRVYMHIETLWGTDLHYHSAHSVDSILCLQHDGETTLKWRKCLDTLQL